MNKKDLLRLTLTVVKYIVTAILGYIGGTELL